LLVIPHPFISEADYNLHVLQIDWPLIYEKWKEWAGTLTDSSARGDRLPRHERRSAHEPGLEIVLHVVNHGSHHRGQSPGFLRALRSCAPAVGP